MDADRRHAIRSLLSRILAPSLARCYRCKTSLFGPIRNERHETWYGQRGCFPLCERCWSTLTPSERLPYYDQLVDTWIAGIPTSAAEYDRQRDDIRRAVMLGG